MIIKQVSSWKRLVAQVENLPLLSNGIYAALNKEGHLSKLMGDLDDEMLYNLYISKRRDPFVSTRKDEYNAIINEILRQEYVDNDFVVFGPSGHRESASHSQPLISFCCGNKLYVKLT